MKKSILLLSLAALISGCSTYPPNHAMYSDYGFTYDYRESPVPAAVDVPATPTTTSNPTFLVQVPPPTVIYQTTSTPVVQSSVDTNATAEANPYKGSYLIPPKVVVVPQQTIIREAAGAAPGGATNVIQGQGQPAYPGYPGNTYVYPGFIGGVVDTNVSGTNTNNVVITNTLNNTNNVAITNTLNNTNTVVITNNNTATNQGFASATNRINEAAGAQRTNAPFATRPNTNAPTPAPVGTRPTSALDRPPTQSTTGSGTGQPAQTTTGGSFAPPPPGTTPLPGTEPKTPPRR